MPNVGLFTSSDPLPPEALISIRYTVGVEGLPVYTEFYDVRKLADELKSDREGAVEAWTRRLEAPVHAREEPEFSAQLTAHIHRGAQIMESSRR